jgi:hypothetical protein
MTLNRFQAQAMYEQGYVVIPGVVPRVMVDAALRAVNANLGQGIDPEKVPIYQSRSFCPELQSAAVMTDLFNATPARALVESFVGEGNLRPVGGAQIALRFPRDADPPSRLGGHLDGMYSPLNGVAAGTISNFTMLAVILLSDVPAPWSGNFTVWPGTHHGFESYFREHGPEALLQGMPPIEYPEPVQICGRAGDLVLAHYQLAHAAGPNSSPHVRYAAIFRCHHVDHGSHRPEAMTDLWLEWPAVRAWREAATA